MIVIEVVMRLVVEEAAAEVMIVVSGEVVATRQRVVEVVAASPLWQGWVELAVVRALLTMVTIC